MTTEAQRIADDLRSTLTGKDPGLHIETCLQASTELRRLEAENDRLKAMAQPAQQTDQYEAWYDEAMVASNEAGYSGVSAADTIRDLAALLKAPQPAQQPLTDEQIMAIGRELGLQCRLGGNPNIDLDYARAIEAAHNIKGESP